MSDRLAKFTEDPIVAHGTPATGPGKKMADGMFARITAAMASAVPSKAIAPVTRIERRFPSVRLRVYFAMEGGTVWISPGTCDIPVHRFALGMARLWWRRWRQPVPPARVVQR